MFTRIIASSSARVNTSTALFNLESLFFPNFRMKYDVKLPIRLKISLLDVKGTLYF